MPFDGKEHPKLIVLAAVFFWLASCTMLRML